MENELISSDSTTCIFSLVKLKKVRRVKQIEFHPTSARSATLLHDFITVSDAASLRTRTINARYCCFNNNDSNPVEAESRRKTRGLTHHVLHPGSRNVHLVRRDQRKTCNAPRDSRKRARSTGIPGEERNPLLYRLSLYPYSRRRWASKEAPYALWRRSLHICRGSGACVGSSASFVSDRVETSLRSRYREASCSDYLIALETTLLLVENPSRRVFNRWLSNEPYYSRDATYVALQSLRDKTAAPPLNPLNPLNPFAFDTYYLVYCMAIL